MSIHIHVTRKNSVAERHAVYDTRREAFEHPGGDSGSSAEGTARADVLSSESVKIESGRPDFMKILGDEVQSANGKLSVSGEFSTLQYSRGF